MMQIRKLMALGCAAAMLFATAGCQGKDPQGEQEKFDAFLEQEFVDAMEGNYVNAHVYMQDPESFGVDASKMEVSLGSRFDEATFDQSREAFKESYDEFKSFDRELLNDEQKDLYDNYAFEAEISEQLMDEKFDYYEQLFQSMSGLQFQLPTLFSDWDIRSEQDVKDLIVLLQDVHPYIESALEYTKTQEEKGLLMVDAESVMDYCKDIADAGAESSILKAMQEKVDELDLDQKRKDSYRQQLEDAFVSSFIPAYQDIYSVMNELKDADGNNKKGLAAFPDGKEYFELLLTQNIGSDKTVKEVKEMMNDAYESHLTSLQMIAFADMDALEPLLNEELPSTGYQNYDEILNDVSERMTQDFPKVSDLSYHIENMNEEVATDGIAAYFNVPPMDGNALKQLRVNPDGADPGSISTYMTVCHEGFPGHMYQYAYLYENCDNNYVKTMIDMPAYVEGYAVYAENQSIAYLDSLNQNLLKAYQENDLATGCVYVLADIGVHYEGWSVAQLQEYLGGMGFALNDEDAQVVYDQLQANPAAFEPYYVGYQEFSALREKAVEQLGDSFDAKAFHEAILESGPATFEVVERHVEAYLNGIQA